MNMTRHLGNEGNEDWPTQSARCQMCPSRTTPDAVATTWALMASSEGIAPTCTFRSAQLSFPRGHDTDYSGAEVRCAW
jgi:hypothetical protein